MLVISKYYLHMITLFDVQTPFGKEKKNVQCSDNKEGVGGGGGCVCGETGMNSRSGLVFGLPRQLYEFNTGLKHL